MKKNLIKVLMLFFSISIFAEGAGIAISEEEHKTIDSILDSWHESYELLSVDSLKNQTRNQNAIQLLRDNLPIYCIRIEWTDDEQFLEFWMESYYDRLENRKQDFHKKVEIPREAVDKILELISECDFYNQPPYVWTNGRDGYTKIVEVNINEKYWCVERWSPDKTFLRDISKYMYDLAGEGDRLYPPEEREKDEKYRARMERLNAGRTKSNNTLKKKKSE